MACFNTWWTLMILLLSLCSCHLKLLCISRFLHKCPLNIGHQVCCIDSVYSYSGYLAQVMKVHTLCYFLGSICASSKQWVVWWFSSSPQITILGSCNICSWLVGYQLALKPFTVYQNSYYTTRISRNETRFNMWSRKKNRGMWGHGNAASLTHSREPCMITTLTFWILLTIHCTCIKFIIFCLSCIHCRLLIKHLLSCTKSHEKHSRAAIWLASYPASQELESLGTRLQSDWFTKLEL